MLDTKKTKTEFLQDIAHEYRQLGHPWPATARMIGAWAIETGRWQPARGDLVDRASREIARAMREEYVVDPQSRRVRKMRAVRDEQGTFWVDIDDAEPDQMHLAFSQRRAQVLGDCKQLKTDVDSYNENNSDGAHIQMLFDFTDDLEELEQSTEYPGL